MTTDINKAFLFTVTTRLGQEKDIKTLKHIFSLFWPILCKPWRWFCVNIPAEQQFLK